MASLALHLLTISLGVLFIFLGQLHLTPQFFPEIHNQIKNEYGKLNKEFPLHRQTGWRPYAKSYRVAIGVTSIVSGALLLLGFQQTLANLVLLAAVINAIITFQKLHYGVEYLAASIGLAFLLVIRLVLVSKSKAKQVVKSAKKTVEKKVQ